MSLSAPRRALRPGSPPLLPALLGCLVACLVACEAREVEPVSASPSAALAGDETPVPSAPPSGPYVLALGIAQDGGVPQVGCSDERCRRARSDPSAVRRVASLAVVLPASGRLYLVDATPDLPEQLAALAEAGAARLDLPDRPDRRPVDGVLLTHAHMGHYLGLAHFGFEAVNTDRLPVWCTPRMAQFLRTNGPWSQLVDLGNVVLRETAPGADDRAGERVELGDGVEAVPLAVPHRDELSDTVAWRFRGPRRSLLYVPDIDGWEEWGSGLESAFEGVDVALVDGTFYSDDELPGRDVSKIGHPRITESVERFGPAVRAGDLEVVFTHLNHSNPALDADSAARRALEEAGFRVLEEGEEIEL